MSDRSVLSSIVKHMKNSEDDPFSPLVDEYLIKRELPEYRHKRIQQYTVPLTPRPRPPGRLSPSKIAACERQAAFSFMGVEGKRRVNPQEELTLDSGTWHHHKWQAMSLDMERVLGRDRFRSISIEESIWIPELYVAGSLDLIVAIKINGKWKKFVIDIKTLNSRGFDWIYQNREPKEAHVRQLLAYMRGKKIRRGSVVYENRNDNRFYPFFVEFDKETWKEVEEWCKKVLRKMEDRKLPKMHPECDHGNFLYSNCPYRRICWGDEDEDDIQDAVYKDFPGIVSLWEEGNRVVEEFEEAIG